jgi:hypothetical protein
MAGEGAKWGGHEASFFWFFAWTELLRGFAVVALWAAWEPAFRLLLFALFFCLRFFRFPFLVSVLVRLAHCGFVS